MWLFDLHGLKVASAGPAPLTFSTPDMSPADYLDSWGLKENS